MNLSVNWELESWNSGFAHYPPEPDERLPSWGKNKVKFLSRQDLDPGLFTMVRNVLGGHLMGIPSDEKRACSFLDACVFITTAAMLLWHLT